MTEKSREERNAEDAARQRIEDGRAELRRISARMARLASVTRAEQDLLDDPVWRED